MRIIRHTIVFLLGILLLAGLSLWILGWFYEDEIARYVVGELNQKLRTEVKIDDVVSDLYAGLTLSFGSDTYTTTNGGKVWPASGTWEFVGDKGDKILRDDGLQITIESANASQLVMSFTWSSTTFDGGRAGSLTGLHRMTFKRKN